MQIISIGEVRWYQENHPEYLTSLYTTVYDNEGIPTNIRAYKLDGYLKLGWLVAPPVKEEDAEPIIVDETPVPPAELPVQKNVALSSRLFPRRERSGE